ncbi:MAG: transcriptional repressor [Alphaproteobacteria bacterium]|jgi:Fur family transcriptional regulator, zinc uptake regulator|nr:transcriptional repressor [Alphaproteobacteria bacterium]MBT7942631.1 transcriptional repressor [Alphaproteobacteria bacterium]
MAQTAPTVAFLEDGHNHSQCLDAALDRAAAVCADKGVRLTSLRRRVLELVWGGHRPLGAYDILASLKAERLGAAPPTVYRALDFLRQQGLVHRIESLNAYVGCPDPDTPHGGQFLICRVCGLAAEMNDDSVDQAIRKSAFAAGFQVGRKVIEIEGLCPHCRNS